MLIDETKIIENIKIVYPNMKERDIQEYIKKAMNDKAVVEMITNFVCYCENKEQ